MAKKRDDNNQIEKHLSDEEMIEYLKKKDKIGLTINNEIIEKKTVKKPEKIKTIQGVSVGYFNVDLIDLPSEGKFLPIGTKISVRAVKTAEIKHFSAMDESDRLDVHERCNMILEKVLKISSTKKRNINYYDLQDCDRIYLLILIRDITFKESENKLYVNMSCNNRKCKCEIDHKEELTSNIFRRASVDDKIYNFYSSEERCFIINAPKYDLIDYKLYIPSLGVTTYLLEFMRELAIKKQQGENIKTPSSDFMQILPFLIGDWREFENVEKLEKVVKKYELQYAKLDTTQKFSIIKHFVELLTISVDLDFKSKCMNGSEVTGNFMGFLRENGFKNLYTFSNILDELF